jgi:hypothetical protein
MAIGMTDPSSDRRSCALSRHPRLSGAAPNSLMPGISCRNGAKRLPWLQSAALQQ